MEDKKKNSRPLSAGESDDIKITLSRWVDPVVPNDGSEPYHMHTLTLKRAVTGDVIERLCNLKIEDVEAIGTVLLLACGYEFGADTPVEDRCPYCDDGDAEAECICADIALEQIRKEEEGEDACD